MSVDQVMANERESRVDILHGYFSERGDSILIVLSSEPLHVSEAARQLSEFLWLANCRSHMIS